MKRYNLKTPVLLMIFKRPDTTAKVFDAIRKAAPAKLYIAADGPRSNVPGEVESCQKSREVVQKVDWPCEVKVLFQEKNLGCRLGVYGAVTWFFSQEPEGIVLEDDCLPEPSFFQFCQEMLEKYRDDKRVMHITGDNSKFGKKVGFYSYYFSRYPSIWGWASWRRAWNLYDLEMTLWPEVRDNHILSRIFDHPKEVKFWSSQYQLVYEKKIDTWDYQWNLVCWLNNALTVTPNVNLISNIGFANCASHTHDGSDKHANMPVRAMIFPLHHPPFVARDAIADRETFQETHHISLIKRGTRKIKTIWMKNNVHK
jgi:hypothetical protein